MIWGTNRYSRLFKSTARRGHGTAEENSQFDYSLSINSKTSTNPGLPILNTTAELRNLNITLRSFSSVKLCNRGSVSYTYCRLNNLWILNVAAYTILFLFINTFLNGHQYALWYTTNRQNGFLQLEKESRQEEVQIERGDIYKKILSEIFKDVIIEFSKMIAR